MIEVNIQTPRTGVALNGDGLSRLKEVLNLGSNELGCSSQGIAILAKDPSVFRDADLNLFGVGKLATLEEVPDIPRSFNLLLR